MIINEIFMMITMIIFNLWNTNSEVASLVEQGNPIYVDQLHL